MDTSPVKLAGDVPAPVSYESLQEASELLLDNLGSSDLSSHTIQWVNFPALMKLWEVLWQAQASLVQEAERLEEALEAIRSEDARLEEVRADLDEIKAGRHDERDRHFALGLYWRRHAIWRYFRTHLQQPEKARDLLHLYLVKPVGGGQQIGETCRPKCNTKTEQALLLSIASKQRNRIRQLAQWLTDHPEAASLLRDTKGKGKSKARDDGQNDVAMKEKAHFERCLEEVESRQRLKELIASTNDWVTCFKSRLEAVRNAKKMLIALQEGQERISRVDSPPSKKQKRPSSGVTTVEVQVPRNTKRRRTVDRGTSPIQEIVERSIYLEQSREYEQDEGSAVIFEHPVANGPIHPASLAQETALQEDDSPPSPQSLPSPPPHAQVRQKQLQNVTDESQQSTTDSSFKPPSLPSVQSLPPVQSSSSADDGFRTIVIREINSVVHDTGVEKQTDSTTEMVAHKVKKPKKRISKVPPIAPEIQLLLEKAALKAEKKRQEEKEAIGAPVEDHWQGLQEWVPPDNQIGPAVEPETTHSGEQRQDNESSMSGEMTGAMYTARSHVVSFEALEADGSSLASQERREREEMEAAGIQEFLKSEDL